MRISLFSGSIHALFLLGCDSEQAPALRGAAGGASAGQAGASSLGGASSSGGHAGDGQSSGAAGARAGGAATGGAAGTGGAGAASGAGTSGVPTFNTRALAMDHVAEGAGSGDIDGDGVVDLVAGPRWYKGPDFALGGTLVANPPTFTRDQYSTFFLTFVADLDGDTRPDVIAVGDAGGGNGSGTPNAHWYRNPGPQNLGQPWAKTALYDGLVANESPAYLDVTGDAEKELVFMTERKAGYARPGASAEAAWSFTAVTPDAFNTPYVHGLGVGDIDGDGLRDIVERSGWWRQTSAVPWERHEVAFGMAPPNNWGGAQMQVFDVDGDGDADVVSALAAHDYGVSWFEQQGTGSARSFVPHVILPAVEGGDSFSQSHAMVAADVNGDGLTDIITGKRYYAHPSSTPDPGTTDAPVLYWFELQRSGGSASFVPHLIHADSGVGCNFVVEDVTGDGKLDIFTTSKRGTFLHVQQ
jgi:hypothetical protein